MSVTNTVSLISLQAEAQGNGYAAGTQFGSDVIGLANGGYAVAYGNPHATFGAFSAVTLRNSAFAPGATNGPHGPGNIDMQGDPSMVRLANGNIAIVWDEGFGGASDMVGAILNPVTGAVIHSEFQVSPAGGDTDPEVAALNNGNWVVAMTNGVQIYLQLMTPTGTRINTVQIQTGTSGNDIDPVIVGLADGGFAIAFINDTNDRGYVQTFDADGTPRTASPVPLFFGGHSAQAVAAMPNGNFAVVFDEGSYGGPGLTLSINSPTGATLFNVRVDTNGNGEESNPDVTVLPNGQILVTWEDNISNGNVIARLFSPTGAPVVVDGSADPFYISLSTNSNIDPSIAQIRQGVFVTSWTDSETDGSGGRIATEVNEIVSTLTSDGANDTLVASGIRDVIVGNGGTDTVSYQLSTAGVTVNLTSGPGIGGFAAGDTYAGVENVFGSAFVDTLRGDGFANVLDGRAGADTMRGMAGADSYYVDNAGDIVDESVAGSDGIDSVFSSISFSLSDATRALGTVERLALLGNAAINGTGNGLNNLMTGNTGANLIDGRAGGDVMRGVGGSDTYVVDSTADVVDESIAGSDGFDLIRSTVSLNLNDTVRVKGSVECVTLLGTANLGATGNAQNNVLVGNSGSNVLAGGVGRDTLTGAGGADFFLFHTTLNEVTNVDRITDFSVVDDTIRLENNAFTALTTTGVLAANAFHIGSGAADAADRIIYNSTTGDLTYDRDGVGGAAAVRFGAVATGLALTNADFVIV